MANLIDALNNAGVSISSVQSSTPATSQPTQSTPQTGGSTPQGSSDDSYVDSTGLVDDTGYDAEEAARQERQDAYDAAKETLKQAIANADPETMSSADGDALATALSELRALDTSGVTTDGAIEGEAENQQTEAENYIYMNQEEYNAILNQIEGLSQSSTTDINTFYDVAAQYNDAVAAYADYKAGTNTEFVQDEANFVMLTESDQQKMMEALATSMSQSMSNNVNEIYQSDDYKILTGEIPATDEEKQQARANFTARKESISEAGTAFSELGLPLPENCQIAEVVDWGSEAKEGDVAANDCMDRIIQNYLAKNNLEGYLTPGQAYDMIMQLNPDIYEDINSGRAIYSGEQFLLPDPSAIRGMDSVEEQIQNEMLANLAENNEDFQNIVNGENAENADVEYDSKNNTITVKDGDNIYVFDSEGNTVEDKTTTTEDVQSNIETAISRSLPGSEYTLSENGIQLEESDRSGRLYADCEITQDGETYNARVVYDPVTGKSTFTVLDEESETYQEFLEYDNENSTVTQYNEDGDKLVQKVNEEGEATASYVYGTDGSLKAVTDSDGNEVTLDDVMDGETITSDFQARAVLEHIANGDTVDDAIERVQNGNYSPDVDEASDDNDDDNPETDAADDNNAESSKEEILSHLDENAPDDIEFEQQEDGTYTAEYITSESVSGPETRTKSVVEYDPETGVTTVRRYDVTNNENDEIQEDQEPSSITEYNENTNTETFTCTSTRYRTGEDPETVEEVYTTVYADDSMSDEAVTRISKEENGNLTLVTTKENGEQTGKYEIEYGDNNEISSVSITGENGLQTTINASDMKDADGNALSQDKIAKIFADINSGDSPKAAFLQNGADEVYETVKNANVKLADGSTSNEVEEFTNGIDELKGVCVPGVSDFQAAGSFEYDEETGIYSMNYTGTRALGTGSSTEEVKYNVTYDPETGITKFEELDSEGEATGDYSEFNSNTMTMTAQYGNAKEITTCKYDENNELKGLGTTRAEYDENNELTNVTVTDVNGRAKTITATELKSLGVGATEVEEVFAKIETGEFSPENILTETFPDLLSDLELSGELLVDRIPEGYAESGGNIEPSEFLEEWDTHVADGTLHDYLIENLDSNNIGELLEYLQSEEQQDGNFAFANYCSQIDTNGMEYSGDISTYIASILATADVENMTESQYDAYIKTISNEMQMCNLNNTSTPAYYLLNSDSSELMISDQILFDAAANLYETDSYLYENMYTNIGDIARQRLDNAYVNTAVNSDVEEKSDYDTAVKLLSNSLSDSDGSYVADAFVQKITDGADNETVGGNNYNRLLLDVALKYKEETGVSLMDVYEIEDNADLCKSIVRTLSTLHTTNDKTTNEQVAEILADNLYGAMKGAGTHGNVISAILGKDGDNYMIDDALLRDIEEAFIKQSHNGLTGGYDHTLYKYVNDQSSLGDNRDMYTSRMHYTNDKIGEYLEELGLTE